MGKIVIKKKVSLDFIGEDYKEAYLLFTTMSIAEYEEHVKRVDTKDEKITIKPIKMILETLQNKFIGGKFPQDGKLVDLEAADLADIDPDNIVSIFALYTGQELPKV